MKKIYFIGYFLIALSNLCFAQQSANKVLNQGVQIKKAQPKSVNEIDRLYNKYKDKETITIYSSFGELKGEISTEMNASNKPESITISGTTDGIDAISEIIYELIKQKLKQGYKHYSGEQVGYYTGVDDIKQHIKFNLLAGEKEEDYYGYGSIKSTSTNVYDATYKKGSLYFIVHIHHHKMEIPASPSYNIMDKPFTYSSPTYQENYSFYIINGDNNRKGGTNATKLDF
ncbi:MAG: hypothetical protein LBP63_09715 [Prevotellaceae bacterium]|jgi:hypothetical protein|nr:hypothetical protein [Prevotellaceae bacterium]